MHSRGRKIRLRKRRRKAAGATNATATVTKKAAKNRIQNGTNPTAAKEWEKRRGRKQAWMRRRPAPARKTAQLQPKKAEVMGGTKAEATATANTKMQMQRLSRKTVTTEAKARKRTKGESASRRAGMTRKEEDCMNLRFLVRRRNRKAAEGQ